MVPHRVDILRWLAHQTESRSCVEIMDGTGLPRDRVYPFLGCHNGMTVNRKSYPSIEDFDTHQEYDAAFNAIYSAPGQYVITEHGRAELARQGARLPV